MLAIGYNGWEGEKELFQACEVECVRWVSVSCHISPWETFSHSRVTFLVSEDCGKVRWGCRGLLKHTCSLERVIMVSK